MISQPVLKFVKELCQRVDKLEKTDSANEIAHLKREVESLEWRSRRLNLEIHGVSESVDEDLLEKINEVATKLNVPHVTRKDIAAVHRLPAKADKTPAIITRFLRQEDRDTWLANRHLLQKEKSLFICENITRLSRTLLTSTKEWAKRMATHTFGMLTENSAAEADRRPRFRHSQ